MWMFEPLATEQVVPGENGQLHLSPEGLALSRAGKIAGQVDQALADYDVVSTVAVGRGGRARLRVEFTDDRTPWVIKGVPRPHAMWAVYTVEAYQKMLAWATSEEATKPLELPTIAARIEQHADDLPIQGNLLVAQAIAHRASDMDLEPSNGAYSLRFRIDGSLFPVARMPLPAARRLVRMIKNQARLQAHRTDMTQEGRTRLMMPSGPVDLRVTVLPAVAGEKLNIRLLNPATQLFGLNELGLDEQQAAQFKSLLARPTGAIILCGPGGAGKTTTMYAALQYLLDTASPRAMATIEEPVEFELEGVSQTQVGPQLSFARALSVLLRQDPGVIMLGEIRDPETARIAMRAGMTGQLLLTTIHATGPETAIPRLLDLDAEPYMVSGALVAIVSQRLLRKVCTACAQAYQPRHEELAAAGLTEADLSGVTLQTGTGCPICHNTGYSERTGIFDIVMIDESVQALILARDIEALRASLRSDGLYRAAVDKLRSGITDLAEVIRLLGARQ
jgi:type II secretory ATPase GspE/PulE/Tfp pilus assembly ATPase PilB-like protein